MIDASKGFIKDGNKNRLRAQDIHLIVDTFTRQLEFPRYSRMVPLAEISDAKNAFNLNLPRTSIALSRRTCRTSTPICAAASLIATSMR
jgi:type I restriction-modification system DNA methylase subunit